MLRLPLPYTRLHSPALPCTLVFLSSRWVLIYVIDACQTANSKHNNSSEWRVWACVAVRVCVCLCVYVLYIHTCVSVHAGKTKPTAQRNEWWSEKKGNWVQRGGKGAQGRKGGREEGKGGRVKATKAGHKNLSSCKLVDFNLWMWNAVAFTYCTYAMWPRPGHVLWREQQQKNGF